MKIASNLIDLEKMLNEYCRDCSHYKNSTCAQPFSRSNGCFGDYLALAQVVVLQKIEKGIISNANNCGSHNVGIEMF